jgi:hypothetical protein
MGLIDIFKAKRLDNRNNHSFDEDDRENSLAKRQERSLYQREKAKLDLEELRLTHQITMMERKAELQELKEMLNSSGNSNESGNIEDAALMMLMNKFANPTPTVTQHTESPPKEIISNETVGVTFTDEQIQQIWNDVPSFAKKIAKRMTDEQLGQEIANRIPSINDESIQRAITYIRNKG